MAAETDYREGFGEVSRTVGIVFRYTLLAATLAGIVALAILLAYVFYDAVQPDTADPGWYLVYLLALVLPTVATGAYLRRRTPRGLTVGGTGLGVPVLGLLFGSGAAMLFVDIVAPLVWLGYLLALAVPVAAVVAVERARGVPFVAKSIGAAVVLVASVLVVPGAVQSSPLVPPDWLVMALTLGGPEAALVWRYAASRWDEREGRIAGGTAFVAVLAVANAGPPIGLSAVPATILAVATVVPTGLYAAVVIRDDPANRPGLLFPVVVVGGALLGAAAVGVLGFQGPESWVDWEFLTTSHRNQAAEAGVYPAMVGSIMLMIIVALVSFPLGVGAAVYLEEYAPDNWFTRIVDVNISNLAGVPSVVYGLLGLGLFVTYAGAAPGTVIVGGLTLALLILPIVIISSREAIRSVPDSIRDASYGLGATRWQTIKNVILPEAFPGILTGTILALGRAIGETAPLLVIGAPQVFDLPTELSSRVGALPLQIYVWATAFAGPDFYQKALPAGVIVLLTILLAMNSVAIVLRNRFEREA